MSVDFPLFGGPTTATIKGEGSRGVRSTNGTCNFFSCKSQVRWAVRLARLPLYMAKAYTKHELAYIRIASIEVYLWVALSSLFTAIGLFILFASPLGLAVLLLSPRFHWMKTFFKSRIKTSGPTAVSCRPLLPAPLRSLEYFFAIFPVLKFSRSITDFFLRLSQI